MLNVYAFPDFVLFLFVFPFIAAIFASPIAFKLYSTKWNAGKSADAITRTSDQVASFLPTMVSVTNVLLAFLLVQASVNISNTQALLDEEASKINNLDRYLVRYRSPETDILRPILVSYTNSVIHDEWPRADKRTWDLNINRDLHSLSVALQQLSPTTEGQKALLPQMIASLDRISDLRFGRHRKAVTPLLPNSYWLAFGALLILTGGVASFLEATVGRLVMMLAAAGGVSILISLLFIAQNPFLGGISVTPDAFHATLTSMGRR